METYKQYISQFKVYPSWNDAQAKGYEAHHIVPRSLQDTPDDRCVRLTAFQHIYAHYLLALEDKRAAVVFALMVNLNFDKLSELDKITLEQLEDWARLREEGRSNPDYVKAVSEKSKMYWSKDGVKEHHSKKMKQFYSDPENRQMISDSLCRMYEEHPELREFQSEKFRQMWSDAVYKERMTKKAKETWSREDLRQKVSESIKNYYSVEENKQKQVDKSKEYWSSEEARKHQADIIKATKWWNNGQVNTRSKDCPGQGFVLGRLSKEYPQETRQAASNRMKGLIYWNNGQVNKRSRECPGPGFVKGKLSNEENMRKMALTKIGNTNVKGRHYFNNGKVTVMRYECPEGFVPGKLPNGRSHFQKKDTID